MDKKIIGITQARIGSTRLPGKVLKEIDGVSLLEMHLRRLSKSKLVDEWIVATTSEPGAEKIVAIAEKAGARVYQGSVDDVLDRYYQAAKPFQPDYVVRVTSDCPLVDAALVDILCESIQQQGLDYMSNVFEHTYADGFDAEVFRFSALEEAWQHSTLPSEREHVTPFIWKNSSYSGGEKYKSANLRNDANDADVRLTVDRQEDFELIKILVDKLGVDRSFKEYVDYLRNHPELLAINNTIVRNEGYIKSLNNDSK